MLDADDTLLDNSLSALIRNIKANPSLDILFFDSVTQEESSNRQLAGMNYRSNHSNIISGEEYLLRQQVPWVPWMAVYRREFIVKNQLRFAERVRFEDSDFVMESVLLAQHVQYIPLPVVCYRINGKSTSNIGNDAVKIEERILSAERLYKLIEQHADAYPNGTIIIRGQYQYKFRAILQRNLWRLDYNTIIRLLASYPYRLTPCDDTFITFTMCHKKLYAAAAAIFGPLLKSALHMRSIITKIKE